MKMKYRILGLASVAAFIPFLLGGCAADKLTVPGAQKVLVTHQSAPKNCKYLGEVTANQGNFFTGAWTSNANMQEGAYNELRNKAARLEGNRVVLLTEHAGQTGSMSGGGNSRGMWMSGSSQQTNIAVTGNVYKCPNQ